MRTTILLLTITVLTPPALAVEIRLKDEARCASPIVRLGDIADIIRTAAATVQADAVHADAVQADEEADRSLADLALFPAPPTDQPRELKRQELRELLALCDVNLRDCQFAGAETVVIRASKNESQTQQRNIIRPALHLIPASAYIQKPVSKADANAAAALKASAAPKLVHRNKAVTIHSLWPGVKITASGKALADAALGEAVLVEQADSKTRLLAKVVGPQTVEVRPEPK